MIGQRISYYEIREKLGEGGMGVVYKAEDTKLKRFVALKFLPSHLSTSGQEKARFIQEAQAASAINHPNVCTIYSVDEYEGNLFVAMEFVDGRTLRDMFTRQDEGASPLTARQAIDIGIQIAEGLAAAHEKGVVHRDIKPENIMIRKDGIVQIMDFGLAKIRHASSKINRLTKEGSTLGTAGYMSPEQIQGQDTDHRSDIFSLGVVLYEMFTGQLPFKGVHETALLYEIVNVDPAPMSTVNPGIDPELDRIVLECLQKEPSERHQSVAEISKDFKRFKRESGRQTVSRVTTARQPLRSPAINQPSSFALEAKRGVPWPVVSIVLSLLLLASGLMLWRRPAPNAPSLRLSVSLPAEQAIETESLPVVAISPDGSRVVYKADRKLYQRRLDNFDTEPIAGTDDATSPFFSPDGRWLGFFAGGKLKKVALSGGSPVILMDRATEARGATWSTGDIIVFAPRAGDGLFRIRSDGGGLRQLTSPDTGRNERSHRWPRFLPDGKTVCFTIGTMDSPDYYEDASIASVNVETGERTNIMAGASTATSISTGYLVYSHNGDLYAAPFDLSNIKVTGSAFPVAERISGEQTTGAMNYSISTTGVLAYVPGQIAGNEHRDLVLVDLNGNYSTLPFPPKFYLEPRISPDGRKVAVVVGSEKDFDIWICDLQQKTMSRFTSGGSNRSPVWSPDGQRIAYSDNDPSKLAVVIRRADGGGSPESIPIGYRNYVNDWSSDGKILIVSGSTPNAAGNIYVVPLAGDRKPLVWNETKFDEYQGSLSPDGKWLSYIYREHGTVGGTVVRSFPKGDARWQISVGGVAESHWSRDGRVLYYVTQEGLVAVPVTSGQSLTFGQARVVLKGYRRLGLESAMSFDLAPDQRHILATRESGESSGVPQINVITNFYDEIQKAVSSPR